jgi:hypothetical protein
MSLYDETIPQFIKMLRNLDKWLDKAVAHAQAKSFDPQVLVQSRLAPDQYALVRQIQAACDAAKTAAARLTGEEPPRHPDTEQTLEELRARIQTCLAYVESKKPEQFAGAEARPVALPFLPGKLILGADYAHELALPNFYFHLSMAYAILRHNGVNLGKTDFIGGLKLKDA